MTAPVQFEGFMVNSADKWSNFSKQKFTPKIAEDHDVDIVNECCSVCGSDIHTITGGCRELSTTPLCVGYEVVGRVIGVGKKVTSCKVGDRVGVGAQVQACMQCKNCKSDNENYYPKQVDTYNAPYNLD
ncbi:chaperonin 10-like protein [Bisporella sp. PMI_857]|nr:chaperonin 10-like protein [Bisporella sp. PMI_857]